MGLFDVTTNENDRCIFINEHWSNEEMFGLTMAGNTPLPAPTPKISSVDIPGADGSYDRSWDSGYIRFNPIAIPYVFTHVISRYDETGARRSLNEMNRLMKEHISTVEEWIFALSPDYFNPSKVGAVPPYYGRLYDTGICDPKTKTGYYLKNARCTNFSASKMISSDVWLLQYSIEITTDPYLYEFTANPRTYTMFSGPTDDAVGMEQVTVRIFTLDSEGQGIRPADSPSTSLSNFLWVNDNLTYVTASNVSVISADEAEATFDFRPATVPIYRGKIGVYMNRFTDLNYNGTTYSYRLDDIRVTRGNCTFITSDKIATPYEMGYTDQNGYSIRCKIRTNYEGSGKPTIQDLTSKGNDIITAPFVWGTAKTYDIVRGVDADYIVTGSIKSWSNKFQQVTGASPDTIYLIDRTFGEPFQFDNDPYNELRMPISDYNFYKLENPDVLRRKI